MNRRGLAAVLAALVVAAASAVHAQSFAPFTVKDIRVEGLQRTEPGTVFSYLPVKVGETMTEEKAQAALRALGMAEGRIFDRALLESTELEMKRQYLSRGLYAVEIQTTVTPLERNRVGINLAVTEGEVAKIRGINLVGAKAFSEKELLNEFVLRTPGWLTWYTKHDRYSREKLSGDLETV